MLGRNALAAVLLALCALNACIAAPVLTLNGRSSLRARRNGAVRSQLWTAGVTLGWSVSAGDIAFARDPDEVAARDPDDDFSPLDPSVPCAFPTTCNWETEQRIRAMARAGVYESEAP